MPGTHWAHQVDWQEKQFLSAFEAVADGGGGGDDNDDDAIYDAVIFQKYCSYGWSARLLWYFGVHFVQ